jgi:hypothetical protein
MFDTDGWRIFQKEAEESLSTLVSNAPVECHTNDQWQLRRGEIQKLKQLVGFEEFTKEVYTQLTAPVDEEGDWP